MKATRPLQRCYYFYLLSHYMFRAVVSVSARTNGNDSPPNNVIEAIEICREKLKVDPHFPKIQLSLAQLLDSQIPTSEVDTVLVDEVLQLYYEVGQPPPQVTEKRLPPAKVRFESLTRAGTIAKDIMHDTPKAVKFFTLAINLDGIEESSLLLAFRTIMPTMISLVNFDNLIKVGISSEILFASDAATQSALGLCNLVEEKCPQDTIVDEYRGAILRRARQPKLSYQSYHRAMVKSKQNLNNGKSHIDLNSIEYADLVAHVVRASILTAASARIAGHGLQQQMSFLTDAEQVALPLLLSMDKNQRMEMEEYGKDSFIDLMVDLYNNMGIAEKKHGSLKRARDLFSKALEINPNDGHALVQLASVDDGTADGVVSNVKELDPDYVSELFDGYSLRFESELVGVLQYKGHLLLFGALQRALKKLGKSPLSIKKLVDLGCGTGLLGELVANEMPWVEVAGVDLSQRMVEISRSKESRKGRKVYASLSHDDAATYLATVENQSIDCILSSDVFIYIGDISKVLGESSKCLSTNGLVCFTVESYQGFNADSDGLRLLPSGRFGHSKPYIAEVAKVKGFEVLSWEEIVIRQQHGEDVSGAAVVLRKLE